MEATEALARTIRTAIVHEEQRGRSTIGELLADERDMQVVGEYRDARSAVARIRSTQPDLLFLDTPVPHESARTILSDLAASRPATIFVAEHSRYAAEAFELNAVDYLVKPFDDERFRRSLDRARRHIAVVAPPAPMAGIPRLAVRTCGKIHLLRIDEIDWLETAGNYVRIHVAGAAHLYRDSLHNFESRLDPRLFVRIHRSVIVNIDRVTDLEPSFRREHVVTLQNGTRLTLASPYRKRIEEIVGRF